MTIFCIFLWSFTLCSFQIIFMILFCGSDSKSSLLFPATHSRSKFLYYQKYLARWLPLLPPTSRLLPLNRHRFFSDRFLLRLQYITCSASTLMNMNQPSRWYLLFIFNLNESWHCHRCLFPCATHRHKLYSTSWRQRPSWHLNWEIFSNTRTAISEDTFLWR